MLNTLFTTIIDTINGNGFLTALVAIFIFVVALNLFIYIVRLLGNIRGYIINKSNSYLIENQAKSPSNATLTMPDRVDLTNSVLDMIAFMVNNEIYHLFRTYIALSNPYDVTNLDTDSAKISTNVFDGIKKDLFNNPNLILTSEYLMEYVTKKTITTLLETAQAHNANLKGNRSDVG